ncbi:RNA polymerase sporulation sigma factor SigH [Peptostreptococcus equinus]|uniref:RNA polymerase sigma factor SigS n=1 Tax=Peptostreptococcus equinus TaxID=3003601 RepID=A0ABY7JS37_9FIRM|nr:RNA polymerase sporulation sigma factor SigH [Peptostreptococcus sp. CBA3647]WAW14868.1 RNA polymerase sporulation sigma factor SigH [Peptostreptococcus sp. CBA3647]
MSRLDNDMLSIDNGQNDLDISYLKKAKEGDKDSIDFLIDKYSPMVKSKARLYFLAGADRDDIIQEGMIGLYKAIRDYDAVKTSAFKSFADMCITRQMITAVKTSNRQKHMPLNTYISLSKPVFEDDSEKTLHEIIRDELDQDPEKLLLGKESYINTEKNIMKLLSPFEEEVLNLYLQDKSYQNIAEKLEKTVKAVDNAIQRIKRKLDKYLENSLD